MAKSYGLYCPIARTLDLLGDRWTLLVVRDLLMGKTKFKEFADSLEGIPLNLLADRLKLLESSGVVKREFYCDHPPRAEYHLTEKGLALGPVVRSLASWGRTYSLKDEPCAQDELQPEEQAAGALT